MNNNPNRHVISDGANVEEALRVLAGQVPAESIEPIRTAASQVIALSVDPIAGVPQQALDGLIYGEVQSGKTGVLTVAAAMAADNGFDCIIVLTSDNDELYDQTVERVRQTLRGITVLGKRDWRDTGRFARQLRSSTLAIVCSKNGPMLSSLLEAFRNSRARGLSLFLVDDEADQASLNTNARRPNAQASRVNRLISEIRDYFPTNTYLQVTATPQALFLQQRGHRYRPSFTVLTEPGPDYVGGDAFFGNDDSLLDYVDLAEVGQLVTRNQPNPSGRLPDGLRRALCTFLVAAADRLIDRPQDGFAFLCHVSMATQDHRYVLRLIDEFKDEVVGTLRDKTTKRYARLAAELEKARAALSRTEPSIHSYIEIEKKIEFYIRGAAPKLINRESDDEIALDGAYNFFVGGNKLGRGVTIKNLLVTYYGRNPRRPNADTVLQHARMYGYRERDRGVTRLFLPRAIADNFRSIHAMDDALRDLIRQQPEGRFEGLFLENLVRGTRSNVVDPNVIGMYVAGRMYNPRLPLRTPAVKRNTDWIDDLLKNVPGNDPPVTRISLETVVEILKHCPVDPAEGARLWNVAAISAALSELRTVSGVSEAYVLIRRDRTAERPRSETQGIHSSGEERLAPTDLPTLFLYRQNKRGSYEAVWWPQIRFPDGIYALAFPFGA